MSENVSKWLRLVRLPSIVFPSWLDEVALVVAGGLIGTGATLAYPIISKLNLAARIDRLLSGKSPLAPDKAQIAAEKTRATTASASAVLEGADAMKSPATPIKKMAEDRPLPLRKPMLLVSEVVASGTKTGPHLTQTISVLKIANASPQELAGCTVHFVEMVNDGITTPIDLPLATGAFNMKVGLVRTRQWVSRNLADIETQPPHALTTVGEGTPLPEDSTFQLVLELRSSYRYPTRVKMEVVTTYEYVSAKILSQTI